MEEISIDNVGFDSLDIKDISLDNDAQGGSVDFGGGLEFLMNEKVKNGGKDNSSKNTSLKNLENELSEIDNVVNNSDDINREIKFEEKSSFMNKPNIEIAKATSQMELNDETWDGYKNINSINLEDDFKLSSRQSAQDVLKEKFEILRKLEALEAKGATLSKKYSMESDLQEMKGEYEHLMQEKERSNSIKFQGKILTTMITGLEFLNSKFDPFDIRLDGWSEQINENIDDYDEIFAELHEKYKSKAKMAPELKLLFQLASSGIMIHMTNTMFKSALPGMDDIMRQNPDLMNHFTKAAISSMEKNSPGLSNFMNDFGMSHSQDTNEIRSRPGNVNTPPTPPTNDNIPRNQPRTPHVQSRIQPKAQSNSGRQEMKGPSNIDNLLSSLGNTKNITLDKDSTISIDDIDNISLTSASSTKRKSSKRKSDKNTMALPI